MTDKHNSTPDPKNVKLIPATQRILTVAIQVYAFDPLANDQVACDKLIEQGFLKLDSDGAYQITPAGRRALETAVNND